MSSQTQEPDNVYLKYSWIILVVIGIIGVGISLLSIFGPSQTSIAARTGVNWNQFATANPEMANYLLMTNSNLFLGMAVIAVFGSILAWTGFRHGEKWAWYTMWIFPISNGLIAIPNLLSSNINDTLITGLMGVGVSIITAIAILLPYKAFFPPTATTSQP